MEVSYSVSAQAGGLTLAESPLTDPWEEAPWQWYKPVFKISTWETTPLTEDALYANRVSGEDFALTGAL